MFDIFYFGEKPNLFSHEQQVQSLQQAQESSRTRFFWIVTYLANYTGFDFLWEPPLWQAHQRHAWASQWQKDSGTYLVPRRGFSQTNYHEAPVVVRLPSTENWTVPPYSIKDFDFSWHPDPTEPPMTYQFGTQHQITGGPCYHNGGTDVKYIDHPRCEKTSIDNSWNVPEGLDTSGFDWTWHPDARDHTYNYQFGTQWQKTGGPRYEMPDAVHTKFVYQPRVIKVSKDAAWEVPDSADETSFDWTWHPDATESAYIYQFGTQHQRTGGPRYVVKGARDIKFVDQLRIRSTPMATAIIEIDHLDGNEGQIPNTTKISRYFDNYLDTLRRIAQYIGTEHEFVWICSSICDYTDFDFSWHPEQWQSTMLHVFASDGEKFGDTFFMHVPTFQYRAETCQLLEWYDLNFVDSSSVPRRPMPVVQHHNDSHAAVIREQSWSGPLALFTTTNIQDLPLPAVPLWRDKTKTVVPLDKGAVSVIVPRVAVSYIKTQVYDYPYIDRSHDTVGTCDPLDIVFICNGEHGADHHWTVLNQSVTGHQNRVHRVDGVNGRVAAYQAAAKQSQTPWFFAVFAKLQVNQDFDWTWQPDRMQQAKHYIFHAYNPVNHLVYGHQAMIAYNVNMTLVNTGQGLDFTLDQAHEVVPLISGTAYYDCDPWTCWRTAFREALKLKHSLPDVENEYRLDQWLNQGEGVNGTWSVQGARDALDYYDKVCGEFSQLKKSYEWSWLASYAMMLHPELFSQSPT